MDWDFANELDVNEEVDDVDEGNINNSDSGNDEIDVGKNAGEDIKKSSLLKDFDAVLQDNIDVNISGLSDSSVPENELRRILLRWRQGDYEQMPSSLYLAYFLQEKYDLSAGKPVLVGKDAHGVCFVNAVAADLGYVVFLADYERLVIRQNHHLQGLISKTTINISRIVDVNGKPISRESILKTQLDSVIEPKDLEPDDEWTMEGIHIWDSAVSRHWFRGTVLLLIHGDDVEDILIAAMEVQDAFLELRFCSATNYPTAKTKKLVRHILKLLTSDIATDRSLFRNMAELALDRHDLDLWSQLVALSDDHDYGLLHLSLLKRSCQVFGFNAARPSLERMISSSILGEAIAFLIDIPSFLSQFEDTAELDAWYKKQVVNRLKAREYWDDDSIPHLITVARTFGIQCLFAIPLDTHDYEWEYLLDFAESLQNDRQSILSLRVNQMTFNDALEGLYEVVDPSASPDQVMDHLIHRLVYYVFKQVTQSLQWLDGYDDGCSCFTCIEKIQINLRCIELFMMSGQSCQGMVQEILNLPLKDETLKLREVYIPLARDLCPLLKEFKHTVYPSTFGPFICHVIELYSQLLLGSRTYNPQLKPLLRVIEEKFTCDCHQCVNLNEFMKQLYVPERTFVVSRTEMRHFTRQILRARPLARYKKLQSPHGHCIKVIKSDVFSEHRWDVRLGHFRDLLRSIGEDVIEKLMGDRYVDLKELIGS